MKFKQQTEWACMVYKICGRKKKHAKSSALKLVKHLYKNQKVPNITP